MENGAKLVADALLGLDSKEIKVADKIYTIKPPTIKRIVGAGRYLADFGDEKEVSDIVQEMGVMDNVAKALSWFIKGDESIAEELAEGTLAEVMSGIEVALQLIDVRNFTMLSTLSRNVKKMIAKQR